ncbi:MAG: DsbC family protein [Gammaproteobacteria bacterium]
MLRRWLVLFVCLGCLSATAATAGVSADMQRVRKAVAAVMPGVKPTGIRPSPVAGLYEVTLGPQLFYVSADGRYLVEGDVIDLHTHTNITTARRDAARIRAIDAVGKDQMIVYSPPHPRHTITVFTDIDCAYCRKLHHEIGDLVKAGIRVRYLFYPRSGVDTPSYYKAVSVWCAPNRKKALEAAEAGEAMPRRNCENPVKEQMALGDVIGVRGTPTIVLGDGTVLPGYLPAAKLVQVVDQVNGKAAGS